MILAASDNRPEVLSRVAVDEIVQRPEPAFHFIANTFIDGGAGVGAMMRGPGAAAALLQKRKLALR